MTSFPALRSLRLRYIGSGLWPTSDQFAAVLSSADSLRLLSITGTFRLMTPDLYSHSPLLLPYLDELDLSSVCSESDDSFNRLVASIRAPALRILRLSQFTVGFRDLICDSALAASAQFIFLTGYLPFDTRSAAFVRGFEAVTHLGLKECGPCYLQALLADPGACPLLVSLVLARVRVADVYHMPATILDASPTDNLTSKLPFEVILMIFHLVVFATHWKYRPTYHQLHAMRMKLARVSPIWSEFIFTNPSFWTHILLSYSYTEATIAHLGRSGDLPLHLHIQFVRSIVYYAAPPHDTNFLDEIIDARLAIVSPIYFRLSSVGRVCQSVVVHLK
ncbi:hypothetical protein C8J57DRAFT_1527428 [Mycena rebaudengoi]|nr:hypothetical protein C8J57DRAFT_1527428 [Mycena rebaudengoi]